MHCFFKINLLIFTKGLLFVKNNLLIAANDLSFEKTIHSLGETSPSPHIAYRQVVSEW